MYVPHAKVANTKTAVTGDVPAAAGPQKDNYAGPNTQHNINQRAMYNITHSHTICDTTMTRRRKLIIWNYNTARGWSISIAVPGGRYTHHFKRHWFR